MAGNKAKLNISSLDFDSIKNNFIDYLKGQDQFKDYNFEGAGISTLLDILAYNTHYMGYYANMVANETFLDSALLRPSIVSIAKQLNYTPKSYKSSVGYVDVQFLDSTQYANIESGFVYVNAGDRFITNTGTRTYLFTATQSTRVNKETSGYFARNVEIKEGAFKSTTFVYNTNQNTDQKFVIPDVNVDIDSLEVRISNSTEDNTGVETLWQRVTDITLLNSSSVAYFIQQNSDLLYEIYFGDGILGKSLDAGNVINIYYRVTSGADSNDIGKFDSANSPAFRYIENSKTAVSLVLNSDGTPASTFGGSNLETLNSIKYYAPRNYQAQERAVTAEDYRTLLATQYGEQAESVFVWGGEDNDPPVYGKVFISIKPKDAEKLTQVEKLSIAKNILQNKNVVTIIPEIIDPDYLYLIFNTTIQYDKNKTTLTSDDLANQVRNILYVYLNQNIGKFDRDFVYSSFSSYITTNFNPPVLSNNSDLSLLKKLTPNLTTISSYTVAFDNELYHPIDGYQSILSTNSFGYQDLTSAAASPPNVDAFLDDDGNGKVRIYKLLNSEKIYLTDNIGTINYTTGKITLLNFVPQYLDATSTIELTVIPKNKDITSRRNQILLIDAENITVNAIPQTLKYDPYSASGDVFTGI